MAKEFSITQPVQTNLTTGLNVTELPPDPRIRGVAPRLGLCPPRVPARVARPPHLGEDPLGEGLHVGVVGEPGLAGEAVRGRVGLALVEPTAALNAGGWKRFSEHVFKFH